MSDEAKTNNILDLSQSILDELESLNCRLMASFNRGKVTETTEKDRAESPNVLDNIMSNLETAAMRVKEIHEFIVRENILKIHKI